MNQRPSGYEPDELPNCSIPRYLFVLSPDSYIIIAYNPLFVKHYFQIPDLTPFIHSICNRSAGYANKRQPFAALKTVAFFHLNDIMKGTAHLLK